MNLSVDAEESILSKEFKTHESYNNIFSLIEKKNYKLRRVGFGTFSFFLSLFAIVFIVSIEGEPCLGDMIFFKLRIPTWSRINGGFHYPVVVSLLISYLALLLSEKYHYQVGARLAKTLSKVYSILLTSIIMVYIYI